MQTIKSSKILFVGTILSLFITAIGCGTREQSSSYEMNVEYQDNIAKCEVVRIVDGDTLVIDAGKRQEKLRLIGIDTPEVSRSGKKDEPMGREASNYTKRLLLDKKAKLVFDVQQRDRYGRLLGYIYLMDGTFVNAQLVKEGYARVMTVPPNVKYADYFTRLQKNARLAKKGLWGIDK